MDEALRAVDRLRRGIARGEHPQPGEREEQAGQRLARDDQREAEAPDPGAVDRPPDGRRVAEGRVLPPGSVTLVKATWKAKTPEATASWRSARLSPGPGRPRRDRRRPGRDQRGAAGAVDERIARGLDASRLARAASSA